MEQVVPQFLSSLSSFFPPLPLTLITTPDRTVVGWCVWPGLVLRRGGEGRWGRREKEGDRAGVREKGDGMDGGGGAIIIRLCLEQSRAVQRLEVPARSRSRSRGYFASSGRAQSNAMLPPPRMDVQLCPPSLRSFACSFERNVKLNK